MHYVGRVCFIVLEILLRVNHHIASHINSAQACTEYGRIDIQIGSDYSVLVQ